MKLNGYWLSRVNIKVQNRNMPETIAHIESAWNKVSPDFLFEYKFLDENFEQLYNDEMRLGKTFMYLAFLAIFIASIGLLGLSLFLAEQRTKEIGIRKSMGDSTAGIVWLFSKEFSKWVILSGFVAMPLGYYIMNKWLDAFANRVSVDGYILAGSCLIALLVAIITVVGQTHRIAARNPVDALRCE
jgi:putative ABC transport system permease protein